MSVANSVQKGDFDLNVVSLRKPLEFPNGSVQSTASSPPVSKLADVSIGAGIPLTSGLPVNNVLTMNTLVAGIIQVSGYIAVNTAGVLTDFICRVDAGDLTPSLPYRVSAELNTTGSNQTFYIPVSYTYEEAGTSTSLSVLASYTGVGCDIVAGRLTAYLLKPN